MSINFEAEMSAYILRLKESGSSKGIIDFNRRCSEALQAHLTSNNIAFTMEIALQWLESRKSDWSHTSYCAYRNALFRFEKYLCSGSISRTRCHSTDQFACRDTALKMPKQMYELFVGFKSMIYANFNETNAYNYSQGCKDFLLFLAEQGCNDTARLTVDPIIAYANRLYSGKRRLSGTKTGWLSGIVHLLVFLAERGDIPYCYSAVLPRNTATLQLLPLELETVGTAFQPSKTLEPLVPNYMSSLDDMQYHGSSKQLYNNDFTNFFLFIEFNRIDYSSEAVELWLDKLPSRGRLWEQRRHTLKLFGDY
jgi:hypothetical protein